MASRATPPSDGEVFEPKQKAISNVHPTGRKINSSDRAFGYNKIDRASRRLSRSPPPFRNTSRSPSPYRRNRNTPRSPAPYHHRRGVSRSPSPYRHRRIESRSPSPYRRPYEYGRDGGINSSRSQQKRKVSPPRGDRPDKRQHTDRNRHDDRAPRSQHDNILATLHSNSNNARENHTSASYPREDLSGQNGRHDDHRSGDLPVQQLRNEHIADGHLALVSELASESKDVEMTNAEVEPAGEKAPPQETREEKRRRWAAIRAAAAKESPKDSLLQQAVLANASEGTTPAAASPAVPNESSLSIPASPQLSLDSAPASPGIMLIDKQGGAGEGGSPAADSPSAADYDPTKDMLDDRERAAKKAQQAEISANAYNETDPKLLSALPEEKVAPVKKQKKDKEFDMFNFDSDNEDEEEEPGTRRKGVVLDRRLLDNWDDPDGYYKIIRNELVNDSRYRMISFLGKGVFANVAQAEDVNAPLNDDGSLKLVAVKIIRRNDLMRAASQKEMDFVRKLNEADPHDKRHIVRLLSTFDHKGHLCGIFEHMAKNLRDLLKEDTSSQGITMQAVRVYARQMFVGLLHLQNCHVVHCDLKPDNILVSHDRKTIKLCDFGTAVDKRDIMERTEYLVSRFYRAPEIILGMDVGHGIDMWAIGCTLYELWTGKILFTGRSNNQMVKAFMDCLGWPTEKFLKKGQVENILEHFEPGSPLQFISREVDEHGHVSVRKIQQPRKIARDLRTRVHEAAARDIGPTAPTKAELTDFTDLLGACLHLNVEKRIQPKDALMHKFFPQQKLPPKQSVVKPMTPMRPVKSGLVKPPMIKRPTVVSSRK
ncbi:kinase-like protein [Byssothecium circinans]|uniref:non-specific serine/threonine protein kinase n=1 Tax=Byssothecium circinans TaxID=147558 RepID=A0A6A5UAE0_9PLEO|nr:kinase-like protein [Byssothecium circinans]